MSVGAIVSRTPSIQIGPARVAPGERVYLIAEAGVNHNGRLELAHRMIDAAGAAGVDAIKFQIFRPEALAASSAHKPQYMLETSGGGSQRDLLAGLALAPWEFEELRVHADEARVEFLCTPFDRASLAALVRVGVRAIKMASTELTDTPLLRDAAATGLPLLLSTGTCTLDEVADALAMVDRSRVLLFHCVSSYPTADEDANLRAIGTLAEAFGVPVGFSDHTAGLDAPALAVAAGACALEKHFTLDPAMPGPDHRFSLAPEGLGAWVERVRQTERILGHGRKTTLACEEDVKLSARKSVVVTADLPAGAVLEAHMLDTKRPGTGIEPAWLDRLAGCRTCCAVDADTILTWEMIEGGRESVQPPLERQDAA